MSLKSFLTLGPVGRNWQLIYPNSWLQMLYFGQTLSSSLKCDLNDQQTDLWASFLFYVYNWSIGWWTTKLVLLSQEEK